MAGIASFFRRHHDPPAPPDTRTYLEKLGFTIVYEPWTDKPGQPWEWVLSQCEGADYWNASSLTEAPAYPAFRRKCWPIKISPPAGVMLPAGDGCTEAVKEQWRGPWKIWPKVRREGWESKDERRSFWIGWGGCIGADTNEDDFVRYQDGTTDSTGGHGWTPSEADKAATDWERIDS